MTVSNCTRCNKIFQRTMGPLCPVCQRESASQLSDVYRFIQNNPRLTLEAIATHCRMPYKELEEMFLNGKLGTVASSVIYPCQRCNRPMSALVRRGRFCIDCAGRIETQAGLHPALMGKPEPKPIRRSSERPSKETPHSEASPEEPVFQPPQAIPTPPGANPKDIYGFKRVCD